MSLQSLTSASQSNAESTTFAVEMNAGKLSNDKYLKFLWNMYMLYAVSYTHLTLPTRDLL